MGINEDIKEAQESIRDKKETYSSWMDTLFGPDREDRPLGEKLVGGSNHGRELADEIVDDFDNKLDPEEQKMVREEIKKAIQQQKRMKAKSLAHKKLNEKKVKENPDDLPLAINRSGDGGDSDKDLDDIGGNIVGLGKTDEESEEKAEELGGLF